MNIEILREACCFQDDQLGPLCIQLNMHESTTLDELIKAILDIHFLQYSETHCYLAGSLGGLAIVEIKLPEEEVIYLVDRNIPISRLFIDEQSELSFKFLKVNPQRE